MKWIEILSATATNGSGTVVVTASQDFSKVQEGWALAINDELVEISKGTATDASGRSTLTLRNAWTKATFTGPAAVFPTATDFIEAAQSTRELAAITQELLNKFEPLLTSESPTIPFKVSPLKTIDVVPWGWIIKQVMPTVGSIASFGGMNAATFNAMREYNKNFYAASGFVEVGKHDSASLVNPRIGGLWTDTSTPNVLKLGKANGSGDSKTDAPVLHIAGVLFHLSPGSVTFPEAPDGTVTYNKATGAITKYPDAAQAFAASGGDVEVVTDRVDMYGFEMYLEEVSVINPYVYPNGIPQKWLQPTTMDGIPTIASNRPVTYYAVFDGDNTSKGKGVNYFNLTDAQKKKVLANPKNNLYFLDDGRLVQWRLRQRTIAGAGNGDWEHIDSVGGYTLQSSNLSSSRVEVQGELDTPQTNISSQFFSPKNNVLNSDPQLGVFTSRWENTINTSVYFLVCDTVNRLNKGGYHPSFNHSGTKKLINSSGSAAKFWYESDVRNVVSESDMFILPSGKYPFNDGKIYPSTGKIGDVSGRPDGRFYDAIYADGQGGVCRDMRYSANGVDLVDFDEADLRVKSGEYRGFEKLVFSIPERTPPQTSSSGTGLTISEDQFNYIKVGIKVHVQDMPESLGTYTTYTVSAVAGIPGDRYIRVVGNLQHRVAGSTPVVISETLLNNSVGGKFFQTDVIGDLVDIIKIDSLKNGWLGKFNPNTNSTGVQKIGLTHKALATPGSAEWTTDSGYTWSSTPNAGIDLIESSWTHNVQANSVNMIHYQAFAKQTEPADNAEVYGGRSSLNSVIYSSSFRPEMYGSLVESTLGIITKNSLYLMPNRFGGASALTDVYLDSLNKLSNVYPPEHMAIKMGAANNDSHAAKLLGYNVNINQQAFKQYAATELIHDGTDWVDDGKVTIVDGESTKTNLNGNTVKIVTHKLKEPIGWIK